MSVDIETLKRRVVMLMACPEWPDCGDDEGPCLGCTEATAIIAALERAELLEAAVRKVERRLRANGFVTYADPLRAALESKP
jgi:hypothetical protein